jgi:hypothetical protein
MVILFTVFRPGGASRGINGALAREGWGEYCGYSEVSLW